jgi:hypothetical protein
LIGGSIASGLAGPYVIVAWPVLFPLGALVGSVVGAALAQPAVQVEKQERVLKLAMEKVPETFARCVAHTLVDQASTSVGPASPDEPAAMILEVVVERFGLDSSLGINPPLSFVLTERTRLIRAFDGKELYIHWLTYRGRERPLDDWVSQNYQILHEEAKRACRELAERLADEVFLLYLPSERGQSAR